MSEFNNKYEIQKENDLINKKLLQKVINSNKDFEIHLNLIKNKNIKNNLLWFLLENQHYSKLKLLKTKNFSLNEIKEDIKGVYEITNNKELLSLL